MREILPLNQVMTKDELDQVRTPVGGWAQVRLSLQRATIARSPALRRKAWRRANAFNRQRKQREQTP